MAIITSSEEIRLHNSVSESTISLCNMYITLHIHPNYKSIENKLCNGDVSCNFDINLI